MSLDVRGQSRRLNVLFVIYQMGMGGSERLVYELVCRLDRGRFAPSVAWFEGESPLAEFAALGVPLYRVIKTKRFDIGAMQELARVLEEGLIDVVVAQHFMPAVYCFYGCKLHGRRGLVFTAHSRWELEELPWKWRVVGGHLLKRADANVGVSRDVSDAIQSVFLGRARRPITIENGVELLEPKCDADRDAVKLELGIPSECPVIAMVANFKNVKNHLFLLEAFGELASAAGEIKLVLVGRGFQGEPDNTEGLIRGFVRDRGLQDKVIILGYRSDVGRLLGMVDVFCLTSLMEGLPISLIEAMSAGIATIGTNVPGIRDVIEPGIDGLLIELGNVEALVSALKRLIADEALRSDLGRAAREKVQRRFSMERCVRSYEKLLLDCWSVS